MQHAPSDTYDCFIFVFGWAEDCKDDRQHAGSCTHYFLFFSFRNVKLRPRDPACRLCGDSPSIRDIQPVPGPSHDKCVGFGK